MGSPSLKGALVGIGLALLAVFAARDVIREKLGYMTGGPEANALPASRPFVPKVRVERARLDAFEDRVEALGTLRANESVALTAPVTDIVSAIHFEDGQRVEKGQILVEMVTAEEKALKTEATAAVEEARSQFLRAKDLAARKFTSESLLDQRRREFETAEARLKAIEARLADRVVVAPFAGTIGLRTISLGALVEPDRSIARLEDDSVMKLDFSVPSTFLATLKPGLSIVARARGFDGETFSGSLASVDNAVDEVTRTIRVRALIPNPDRRLKPGLLMTVDLLKNPRTAVVVPEEALVPAGGNVYVFVVDEASRKVERRPVVMGARRAGEVEVAQGLKEGELVVTEGSLKLAPGMAVVVEDGPPAAAPTLSDEAKGAGGRS